MDFECHENEVLMTSEEYRQVTRPSSGFRHILMLDCVATNFRQICSSEDGKYRGCCGYVRFVHLSLQAFTSLRGLMFPNCAKDLVHIVSSRLEVEVTRGRWRLPGGSHTSAKSQRKVHAQLSLSAMFVIKFMFWYSFFPLLSM